MEGNEAAARATTIRAIEQERAEKAYLQRGKINKPWTPPQPPPKSESRLNAEKLQAKCDKVFADGILKRKRGR